MTAMLRIPSLLQLALLLTACGPTVPAEREPNPLEAPPVDTAWVGSAEQAASWRHRRETSADLDGDGQAERVVLTADVEVTPKGLPLWEDGHRWAVFVESASGERTMLYGAFVPNGSAEAAVLIPDQQGHRRVLVQERTPQQVRALEVEYAGPGVARSVSSAYYQIGQWLIAVEP